MKYQANINIAYIYSKFAYVYVICVKGKWRVFRRMQRFVYEKDGNFMQVENVGVVYV